jgi:hypothetical protein
MPGVTLYVMGAIERDGPWAPALVLGATHAWRSDLAEQGGTASFVLDAATVDACPLRVRRFGVTARPCLAVLVGRFVAQGGGNTDRPQTVPRPFAATGGALTASAGSTVQLFGRFGLGVTVVRDAYEFATDVFHRASLFMFSASIGVGARWR